MIKTVNKKMYSIAFLLELFRGSNEYLYQSHLLCFHDKL